MVEANPFRISLIILLRRHGKKMGPKLVVKIGVPRTELSHEKSRRFAIIMDRAASGWSKQGPDQGILLLERLRPGNMLAALVSRTDDEEATRIAAGVMRQLWRPVKPDAPFKMIDSWFEGLGRVATRIWWGLRPVPGTACGNGRIALHGIEPISRCDRCCCTAICIITIYFPLRGHPGWRLIPKG